MDVCVSECSVYSTYTVWHRSSAGTTCMHTLDYRINIDRNIDLFAHASRLAKLPVPRNNFELKIFSIQTPFVTTCWCVVTASTRVCSWAGGVCTLYMYIGSLYIRAAKILCRKQENKIENKTEMKTKKSDRVVVQELRVFMSRVPHGYTGRITSGVSKSCMHINVLLPLVSVVIARWRC